MARGWQVVVRDGPRVTRHRAETLDAALVLVERAGGELAAGPGRAAVELRIRTFSPQQQVAGRIELRGPGVRAGVDVRGDGSCEAFTGRVRRTVVEQRDGETALAALRRVLS